MDAASPTQADGVRYAGFWRRFGALLLDLLILSPYLLLCAWAQQYRAYWLWGIPRVLIVVLCFHVYLVRRYGGTPGKLLEHLQIRKVNLEPVGYREAILRELLGTIISLLSATALLIAALKMTDAQVLAGDYRARMQHIEALQPSWAIKVVWVRQLWWCGEVLFLLSNDKKRTISDFIAGTVVVIQNSRDKTALDLPEAPVDA